MLCCVPVDELHLKYLEASFEGFGHETAFRMRWPVVAFIAAVFVAMLVDRLRSTFSMADAPRRVVVLPAKRLGLLGVGLDVASQLPRHIRSGREDAPRQHIPLHFRELQLDLTQPRRMRRGQVQRDVRVLIEKRLHELRLVGRQGCRRSRGSPYRARKLRPLPPGRLQSPHSCAERSSCLRRRQSARSTPHKETACLALVLELFALGSGQMNRLSFKGHMPRRLQPHRKHVTQTSPLEHWNEV